MKVRVADYIANFLVEKGVKDIFVLTGYGAMYLNDALVSNPKIKYYCVRNEAASPMMAESYARLKGTAGAVCLTAGPGSTNAVPGLAEAWVDSAPVIILSGQVHKAHTTYMANIPDLRTFGTAEINIIPIVKPMTKYAEMVTDPKTIRYHMEKAYFLATKDRPGPVWLDIPHDVQSALVDVKSLRSFKKTAYKNPVLNLKMFSKIMHEFRLSKKPVLVMGSGVRLSEGIDEFNQLLKEVRCPVFSGRLGNDILPYSNEFNMGMAGIKGRKFSNALLKDADFVLVIGSRLAIPFVGDNLDIINKKAKVAVVDISQAELKKPGVHIEFPLNADAKIFINSFLHDLKKNKYICPKDWLKFCQNIKNKYPIVNETFQKNPIDLYYFMSRLDALSGKNNVLITDAGSNYYVGGQVFKFEKGQREITSGTFAAMGLGIPLAIGASIADRKKQVLAVTGDGSLELNIQELKTMSYYNLNIKLFVINNNGYLSMRKWQDAYFNGRRIGSDDDTGAEILNLKKVADAFDLSYEVINSWKDVDSKLKKLMKIKGPIFVEVVCNDKQEIIEPLKELPQQDDN